ncbi:MAG: hypothetical protein ABSD71_01240 [Bacteroidales bacterium]|jgi:hypothetical protein
MKKIHSFLVLLLILGSLILSLGCSNKNPATPCNAEGTLCIENKLDSTIVISIKNTHDQFTILKDYMHCSTLTGDVTYKINVSATGIDRDTAITILTCDKKLLIVQ